MKIGGAVPARLYRHSWRLREQYPGLFERLKKTDEATGALHDFIDEDVRKSLRNFRLFSKVYPELRSFERRLQECDSLVINGEGTLILGNPSSRDALFLIFAIAIAKEIGKSVYLLNAMICGCPYTGLNPKVSAELGRLLGEIELVGCRDHESLQFVRDLSPDANARFIPDALFTWGTRFRKAAQSVPELLDAYVSPITALNGYDFPLDQPYVCVSGSSSAWRDGAKAGASYLELIQSLQKDVCRNVVVVETCDGDGFLRGIAESTGATFFAKDSPAIALGGILSGAKAYITGRYHPAIMASAGGTPCLFMSSNSHKTRSIQGVLRYDSIHEYSSSPRTDEIRSICESVSSLIRNEGEHKARIVAAFDARAAEALEYATCIPG
jgi:polysaccharide pyruvyl transferase WcaK-like protein